MIPYTDAHTSRLIDDAVRAVVLQRAPAWLGDPGPTISVLVSLAAEAEARLDDAVAGAVERGYSWDQIASRLATDVATAWRRYGDCSLWRPTLLAEAADGEAHVVGDQP